MRGHRFGVFCPESVATRAQAAEAAPAAAEPMPTPARPWWAFWRR
jgi:hypothetical protein